MNETVTRVLLVDDHREVATSFARILRVEGFDVTVTFRGEDAVEQLDSGQWDLVLTDLYMPGLTGIDVARRALSLRPKPAVVIMTATPEQDLVAPARELLGRLPLNKGTASQELVAVVRRALSERES